MTEIEKLKAELFDIDNQVKQLQQIYSVKIGQLQEAIKANQEKLKDKKDDKA